MAESKQILFCEPCGHKEIIESTEGMNLTKLADVPGGSPKLDAATKKVKIPKATKRAALTKCPNCGRGVVLKKLPEVYSKALKLEEDRLEKEKKKTDKERRLKDGEPPKRDPHVSEDTFPDFLG